MLSFSLSGSTFFLFLLRAPRLSAERKRVRHYSRFLTSALILSCTSHSFGAITVRRGALVNSQ